MLQTGAIVYSAGEVRKQADAQGSGFTDQCNGSTNYDTASSWVKELFQMCPILALRSSVLKISTARKV